ncbi:MAG: 23S rRNA (pseudouridine(1915)-N(3))-methyltransferase RlmH [Bacteroidales bacterium]|nr:23S rRNA (pseudouridine(1915)-N(3))-methyltransferase RlmH [Bacteroidales bacterium]
MKICLLTIGKTTTPYLKEGIEEYISRISRMIQFEMRNLPDVKTSKKLTPELQKISEGEMILSQFQGGDHVVLLDERGKEFTSRQFSEFIERQTMAVSKNLYFVVGGPYGFSQGVYDRANSMMSLSKMTFPHEMVRMFFVEQLYRACAISRNLPYHHD